MFSKSVLGLAIAFVKTAGVTPRKFGAKAVAWVQRAAICAAVICGVAFWMVFCKFRARSRLLKHSARFASVTPRIVAAAKPGKSHMNGLPPNVGTRDFAERSLP